MGKGLSPRVKLPGPGIDHPFPSSAYVKGKGNLFFYSPVWDFVDCSRMNFTSFIFTNLADISVTFLNIYIHK